MDDLLQEMIDPEPPRHDVARRRRLWASVGVFGLAVVGITSLTTSALFTDRDSVAGDLVSGTVNITSGMTQFTMPTGGLAPKDVVDNEITVKNDGSLQLRYGISYSADSEPVSAVTPPPSPSPVAPSPSPSVVGDLRNVLSLAVWPKGAATTCVGTPAGATPTATPSPDAATNGAVATINSGASGTFQPLLGASDGRTNYRTLDSGTSEVLCVRLVMADADNTYQYTAAHLTLQFDAVQTVNNS